MNRVGTARNPRSLVCVETHHAGTENLQGISISSCGISVRDVGARVVPHVWIQIVGTPEDTRRKDSEIVPVEHLPWDHDAVAL